MLSLRQRSVLPGFGLTLGYTLFYLGLIVLIPLAGTFVKTATLSWSEFWTAVSSPRVLASYRLSFGIALLAGLVNSVAGLVVAWVLVRYDFLGNVNLFHGRLESGGVRIGGTRFDAAGAAGAPGSVAQAFVRPHDVRVTRAANGPSTLPARVVRFHVAGPVAHLELERLDDGTSVSAQLSKGELRDLDLRVGEVVYVELRRVRVFTEDYSI